jgi:putative phosphotransacetylase
VKVIVEVSSRHVHLTLADLKTLFGPKAPLTSKHPVSQSGQFAANETVTVIGPAGRISPVRIVGPVRGQTQVELSLTDAYHLGIVAPVGVSGDLQAAVPVELQGPEGTLELPHGAIVAQRHLHASEEDARVFGIRDGDRVWAHVGNVRAMTLEEVVVRVDPSFVWRLHLDTDEANAAGVKTGDEAEVFIRRAPENMIQ